LIAASFWALDVLDDCLGLRRRSMDIRGPS